MLRPIKSTQREMRQLAFSVDGTSTGVQEVSTITTILDDGALEQTDLTLVADSAGSLNSTYFNFSDALDAHKYYVWYNINGAGVDPAVATRTGIQVTGATNATAATLANATRVAIAASAANAFVAITGATTHVIITNRTLGNSTNTANGTASPGFTITINTQGHASGLNSKYLVFFSALNAIGYYLWLNVNSEGVDPAVAGKTSIPIAVPAGSTANAIATLINAAVAALTASFTSSVLNNVVTITNVGDGATTDIADTGSTGFAVAVQTQGVTDSISILEGFTDAVLTEGSSTAGDYVLTFTNAFSRVPSVSVSPLTADAIHQLSSVSISAVRVKFFDHAGSTAKDADFHMTVLGSDSTVQDGH